MWNVPHRTNDMSTMRYSVWKTISTYGEGSNQATSFPSIRRSERALSTNPMFATKVITSPPHSASGNDGPTHARHEVMPYVHRATVVERWKTALSLSTNPKTIRSFLNLGATLASMPSSTVLRRLPRLYHKAAPHDLIGLVSDVVVDAMRRQAVASTMVKAKLTRFHSKTIPQISVFEYLQRVLKYLRLSAPALLSMLVYFRRLCSTSAAVPLSSLTIHRLLLSCASISNKVLTDHLCSNRLHAWAGGIQPSELTVLEIELLQALSWDVTLKNRNLERCYLDLVDSNGGYILVFPDPGLV